MKKQKDTKSVVFEMTEEDKINMKGWNLDPSNKAHRQEWLSNKGKR